MGISVDNFFGDYKWYFLTHVHSDHMTGLDRVAGRTVYASKESCMFIRSRFPKVRAVELECRKTYDMDDFTVRFIPCDHVIGSVMILIDDQYLFTGDFRYSRAWFDKELAPVLAGKRLKAVYMDNTYEHIPDLPTWEDTASELNSRRGPIVISDPRLNTAPLWRLLRGGVYVERPLRRHPLFNTKIPGLARLKSRARYHVVENDGGIKLTANWFVCQRDYAPVEDRVCFSIHSSANEFAEFRSLIDPRGRLEWISCNDPARLACLVSTVKPL